MYLSTLARPVQMPPSTHTYNCGIKEGKHPQRNTHTVGFPGLIESTMIKEKKERHDPRLTFSSREGAQNPTGRGYMGGGLTAEALNTPRPP